VLENVRWATDRRAFLVNSVFGERSKPKTEGAEYASAKPKRPKRKADWFCRCVFPLPLSACADVTARRSVAHLTFAGAFWRSVQTCSVLLRTEAGGTPAFQSVAALRRTYVVQQGRDARVPVRAASRQTYVV
jgi:hypothetical protein